MIKEFCKVTGIIEEDMTAHWADIEGRVLRFAAFDDKKGVKSVLTSYNVCEEKNAGQWMSFVAQCHISIVLLLYLYLDSTTAYILLLLTGIICPRGKGKKTPILNTFEVTY
jgi:hypothetical protein